MSRRARCTARSLTEYEAMGAFCLVRVASLALLDGFALMMTLDTALG
jgi:hypothetical protein